MVNLIKQSEVEKKIITLREQKVILDSDVAELYGVETMRINEAVKNNPEKFPDGYILSLDIQEWQNLKSKFSISSWGGNVETFTQIRNLTGTIREISQAKEQTAQKALMQKSGDIIADIVGDNLVIDGTETTFEINLAMLSFKHTTKKKRK